jgi:thiosulfate dehydrogenase
MPNGSSMMSRPLVLSAVAIFAAGLLGQAHYPESNADEVKRDSIENPLRVPSIESLVIPDGPMGDVIRLGRELIEDTVNHPLTKPYVGNSLNCTSCHLENGTHRKAATFIGIATAYPAYSPREKRVITLEDRVLNCFMRSCNGVRPPLGSRPSVAITTYITWLSSNQPIAMNPIRPLGPYAVKGLDIDVNKRNVDRGKKSYTDRCASCHGDDGQGDGDSPPVWGDMSYNDGAGLAGDVKLASWLKVSMPPDEEDLTEAEALDIAAYINSHPRPKFSLNAHLPPANALGEYNAEP